MAMNVKDFEGVNHGNKLTAYSLSKRVIECMSIALSEELAPHGIVVNTIGVVFPVPRP